MTDLKALIRSIPDYPKPGILFRDITTLLGDPAGYSEMIRRFADRYRDQRIDKVAGIEARGFILGGAIAERLGSGFVPIRKRGKLPAATVGHDYELEYGTDRVEVHVDALESGHRVLLVDDLIATGGTALAGFRLLRSLGAEVVEACFAIDLPDLGGRRKLEDAGCASFCLMEFDGH
ncbi:MAG: adenine phosphoribosyltransferase [Gemmatimonadales bacterium]